MRLGEKVAGLGEGVPSWRAAAAAAGTAPACTHADRLPVHHTGGSDGETQPGYSIIFQAFMQLPELIPQLSMQAVLTRSP